MIAKSRGKCLRVDDKVFRGRKGEIMKNKFKSTILITAMAASVLTGCSLGYSDSFDSDESLMGYSNGKVGVSMPAQELQRWNQDGSNIQAGLEAAGYVVDLQYASNDTETQIAQVESMIDSDCELLVIAAVDGDSLSEVLAPAREKGIPVIAYDRLIKNSDAVSYYATFDNYLIGIKQGEYIRDKLNLDNAAGPFYMEIVAGDSADNNARYFYDGSMDVLQPYIDEGKLVVKSGQIDFETVTTPKWSTQDAQDRMDAILSEYYADGTDLDAVLCASDSVALGAENSLEADYMGSWPIITGQDCDIVNIKNMIAGKQSMSIFKDTRILASKTVEMVNAIMHGGEPPVNDTESYDNGTGAVPAYLCDPEVADGDNYKKLLIDSGYYNESDLQ